MLATISGTASGGVLEDTTTPNLTATFKVQNLMDSYTYYYTFGSGKGGVRDYIENGRYLSLNLNWRL